MSDLVRAFEILSSATCRCGRPKDVSECAYLGLQNANKAVCGTCWSKLPGDIRDGLHRRVGDGFIDAYERAVEYLHRRSRMAAEQLRQYMEMDR